MIDNFICSHHALIQIRERKLPESWIKETLQTPDRIEHLADSHGNTHYLKQIQEFDNRWLRIVINPQTQPHRIVTLFFDRRIK